MEKDHKSLTGEMIVSEYFVDSILTGYIEYDGPDFLRERYFYSNGCIFLDKLYDKSVSMHAANKMHLP